MASKTCSSATTSKATQGASATTRWPIAAIASSSTSAELTAGVGEKTSLTTGETTTGFCKSCGNSAGIASTGTNTGVCTTGTGSGVCTTGTGSGVCTTGTGSGVCTIGTASGVCTTGTGSGACTKTLGRLVRTGRSSALYSGANPNLRLERLSPWRTGFTLKKKKNC